MVPIMAKNMTIGMDDAGVAENLHPDPQTSRKHFLRVMHWGDWEVFETSSNKITPPNPQIATAGNQVFKCLRLMGDISFKPPCWSSCFNALCTINCPVSPFLTVSVHRISLSWA